MIFKKFHLRARSSGQQAFTLVELLVALAVLSILVVVLAQVVSLTSQAIDINTRKLDAAGQARLFFDRLGADLAALPIRADLGVTFTKNPGNDTLQFYTAANGYGATTPPVRQISYVSYSIGAPPAPSTGPNCLIREADGMDWTAIGSVSFLPVPYPGAASFPNTTSANCDVLANGIFRMEFCYLVNTGSRAGQFVNTPKSGEQFSAIVVAVAALDRKSLNILTNAQVTQLAGDFADAQDGSDPLSDWTAAMAVNGFGAGIPRRVIQDIRLFERTFYVPYP